MHKRTKHLSIKQHFIRSQVEAGIVDLKYCPTKHMIADILTKAVTKAINNELSDIMLGYQI